MLISFLGLGAILLAACSANNRLGDAGFLVLLLGLAEILAEKIPRAIGRWRRAASAVGLGAMVGVIASAMFGDLGLPIGASASVLIYCYSKKPNSPPRPISWTFAGVKRKISELFRPDPPAPPRDY